jgi:hypothetical protein
MILFLYALALGFFCVFAALRKLAAVGAFFAPGDRIRSPEPEAILALFLWMFLYNPGLPLI